MEEILLELHQVALRAVDRLQVEVRALEQKEQAEIDWAVAHHESISGGYWEPRRLAEDRLLVARLLSETIGSAFV